VLAVTSTALLAALVTAGVVVLAGVAPVLARSIRNTQRIAALEDDIRDVREDVRFLVRRLIPGTVPPSVTRERKREEDG
jgi:hypothetical protein